MSISNNTCAEQYFLWALDGRDILK